MTRVLISNEFLDLHRGAKDFHLGKALAGRHGLDVTFLHSGLVSLADEDAGFQAGSGEWAARLAGSTAAIRTYGARRLVRRTHNKRVSFVLPNPLAYLWALLRIRPDWIIDAAYTTLTPRSFLNGLYCRFSGAGMIVLDAGDDARNRRILPFERAVLRNTRAIFTYNPASAERIRAKYRLGDAHPFVVHHKMLELADFGFDKDRIRPRPCVGWVGRLLRSKGFPLFLEAAERLSSRADFLAVGHNDDGFAIPPGIEHRDAVPNSALRRVYSEIDVLVLPDLSDFRSYATVVQEALLCGCRVRVGGISPDYFPEPSLVEFHDPGDHAGLERILTDLQELSAESRSSDRKRRASAAAAAFDPSSVVDRVARIVLEKTHR